MEKALLPVVFKVKVITYVFILSISFKPCSIISHHLSPSSQKKLGASEDYMTMLSRTTVFHDHTCTAVPVTEIKVPVLN
jgi:hypothetical protein